MDLFGEEYQVEHLSALERIDLESETEHQEFEDPALIQSALMAKELAPLSLIVRGYQAFECEKLPLSIRIAQSMVTLLLLVTLAFCTECPYPDRVTPSNGHNSLIKKTAPIEPAQKGRTGGVFRHKDIVIYPI